MFPTQCTQAEGIIPLDLELYADIFPFLCSNWNLKKMVSNAIRDN